MAGEVLCFKRANIVHDVASEIYGLFRVTKLPGNRVGIGTRYCFVVCLCMSSNAISGESVRGLPLSTVHAIATLKERILLQKGVPEGTPNVWRVSKAAPRDQSRQRFNQECPKRRRSVRIGGKCFLYLGKEVIDEAI